MAGLLLIAKEIHRCCQQRLQQQRVQSVLPDSITIPVRALMNTRSVHRSTESQQQIANDRPYQFNNSACLCLLQAAAIDAAIARGEPAGALAGVPIAIKVS